MNDTNLQATKYSNRHFQGENLGFVDGLAVI